MTIQTLKVVPTWVHIVTENNWEKVAIIFRKATLEEQQHFEKMKHSQKEQYSLDLNNLIMLTTKPLKEAFEYMNIIYKLLSSTPDTYEDFKKGRLERLDDHIGTIEEFLS